MGTIIQSFVTKVETLMILLLMIISASNGKYYLIETNDNDNKTGQDYMMNDVNRDVQMGCVPGSIIQGREVACVRIEDNYCVEELNPDAATPLECRERCAQMVPDEYGNECFFASWYTNTQRCVLYRSNRVIVFPWQFVLVCQRPNPNVKNVQCRHDHFKWHDEGDCDWPP